MPQSIGHHLLKRAQHLDAARRLKLRCQGERDIPSELDAEPLTAGGEPRSKCSECHRCV